MSIKDILSGYVIQPARSAGGNSKRTASAVSGVVRDSSILPITHINSLFGELLPSQFRCAFLGQETQETEEYLIWAANNAKLATIEDSSWAVGTNDMFFGSANETFVASGTGVTWNSTPQIFVKDEEGRSIAEVSGLQIIRGDYVQY